MQCIVLGAVTGKIRQEFCPEGACSLAGEHETETQRTKTKAHRGTC